jgi:hypothetical protein
MENSGSLPGEGSEPLMVEGDTLSRMDQTDATNGLENTLRHGHGLDTANSELSAPLVFASIANYIRATIANTTEPILLDSGATTSLISKEMYLKHSSLRSQTIRPGENLVAKSANGLDIILLGRVTLYLQIR